MMVHKDYNPELFFKTKLKEMVRSEFRRMQDEKQNSNITLIIMRVLTFHLVLKSKVVFFGINRPKAG